MKRITLTNSNPQGYWQVSADGKILFTGGRVEAEKFTSDYCRANGIASWWNCKRRGVWVEVIVGQGGAK